MSFLKRRSGVIFRHYLFWSKPMKRPWRCTTSPFSAPAREPPDASQLWRDATADRRAIITSASGIGVQQTRSDVGDERGIGLASRRPLEQPGTQSTKVERALCGETVRCTLLIVQKTEFRLISP